MKAHSIKHGEALNSMSMILTVIHCAFADGLIKANEIG